MGVVSFVAGVVVGGWLSGTVSSLGALGWLMFAISVWRMKLNVRPRRTTPPIASPIDINSLDQSIVGSWRLLLVCVSIEVALEVFLRLLGGSVGRRRSSYGLMGVEVT